MPGKGILTNCYVSITAGPHIITNYVEHIDAFVTLEYIWQRILQKIAKHQVQSLD